MTILKPYKKLKKMDSIIDANPNIVEIVHADLTKGAKSLGHRGMSAERVFRCAILKLWKRYPYRELAERIHDCISFPWFTRFYSDHLSHYIALKKVIKSIKVRRVPDNRSMIFWSDVPKRKR